MIRKPRFSYHLRPGMMMRIPVKGGWVMSERERRKRRERQERRERRGERGQQPRFDKHIEFGTQFAYRNTVANSICLSKSGCEHNLLIETWLRTQFAYRNTVWGFGGWVLSGTERSKRRERQERRERRGERGEQPRFDKHSEFATSFR